MKTTYGFSRRGPDRVAEELAAVLSTKASFEFKALFTIIHANLRAKNQASGGEEMLRLRAYEKLQNLVEAGFVKKVGKEYRGVPAGLASFLETAAELNEKFASGRHSQPPANAPVPAVAPAAPVPAEKPKKTSAPRPAAARPASARTKKAPASRSERAVASSRG